VSSARNAWAMPVPSSVLADFAARDLHWCAKVHRPLERGT